MAEWFPYLTQLTRDNCLEHKDDVNTRKIKSITKSLCKQNRKIGIGNNFVFCSRYLEIPGTRVAEAWLCYSHSWVDFFPGQIWHIEIQWGEFPGGLVVRIPGFHCCGPGSIPGWETEIAQAAQPKEKRKKRKEIQWGRCVLPLLCITVSQEAVFLHGTWKGELMEFTHFPFQEFLNTPPMRIWYKF